MTQFQSTGNPSQTSASGWTCSNCNQYVPAYTNHICSRPYGSLFMQPTPIVNMIGIASEIESAIETARLQGKGEIISLLEVAAREAQASENKERFNAIRVSLNIIADSIKLADTPRWWNVIPLWVKVDKE